MDDISKSICSAYRESVKSGIALAKTSTELRMARMKMPRSERQNKELMEMRESYMETILGTTVEKSDKTKRAKTSGPEKTIRKSLIDQYVKNVG